MKGKKQYTARELEATMRLKWWSKRALAKELGISESYLNKIISRTRESAEIKFKMNKILQPELEAIHNIVKGMEK